MSRGEVVKAFGNLLHVRYEGEVRQGEIALVQIGKDWLKGEVIEITATEAKLQLFEESRGLRSHAEVEFTGSLLEAELGPGLLSTIFDALQHPLERVAASAGLLLRPGTYPPPLDRDRQWNYTPTAKLGERIPSGVSLGHVTEGKFQHEILSLAPPVTLHWTIRAGAYPVDTIVAKGIDSDGQEHSFSLLQKWPVKKPLLFDRRSPAHQQLTTGLRVIDDQLTLAKGGTFCTPGPFGAGKTMLQQHLAKYAEVDIVILVACGERAGEVVEILRTFPRLTDKHSSEPLLNRTVIICNTSSMPVAAREASIYLGTTIGEYYRQMGLDVLLLADSTSRWAQGMREISGRLEEIPGDEAFPAYLSSRIAAFYERAGFVHTANGSGSLTIGGTVSPAGGNFEEPVTQATLGVVGAFHALSRDRARARRYPAIDPLLSWSNYRNSHNPFRSLLQKADEISRRMEVLGEQGVSLSEYLTYLHAELYDGCYLQQNAFDEEDSYSSPERRAALATLLTEVCGKRWPIKTHDEAKKCFLELQALISNMNTLPFHSPSYEEAHQQILNRLHAPGI